jgi:hypothetical protein
MDDWKGTTCSEEVKADLFSTVLLCGPTWVRCHHAGKQGHAFRSGRNGSRRIVVGHSMSHHHHHSAWLRAEQWRVYVDPEMTYVDCVMGSIYYRDRRID